jgi:hypothetical protein
MQRENDEAYASGHEIRMKIHGIGVKRLQNLQHELTKCLHGIAELRFGKDRPWLLLGPSPAKHNWPFGTTTGTPISAAMRRGA